MFGILLGLIVLVALAYRGYSIIWVAPVAAMVVAITGGLDLLPAYTETYMEGLVVFTKSWFPVFLFGAVFGKLMEVTGCARSIAVALAKWIGAKRAILAVVIGCAVMTYGGVSLFVVVFAIYPMALELFRNANLPRRLIPGAIALGAFTFTMTALPGSPQLNNLIAAKYLGTTPMAAPIIGIVSALVMAVCGYLWLIYREKKLVAAGEAFTEPEEIVATDDSHLPNPILAFLPLVVVVITLNVFDFPPILAIGAGIIVTILPNLGKWRGFSKALNEGASGSVMAILNTSAAVGFGAVVKAVPGFQTLTDMLLGMGGSPLVSEAVSITLLAGATGSSSGGMTIALEALGAQYLQIAQATNISPEVFHRVATVASGGLDSLPHCGAVITLLAVCGLTHKEAYNDIGMVTCVLPIIACVVAILLGTVGIV